MTFYARSLGYMRARRDICAFMENYARSAEFMIAERAVPKIYERFPRFTSGSQDLRAVPKIYERFPRFTSGSQDLRAVHLLLNRLQLAGHRRFFIASVIDANICSYTLNPIFKWNFVKLLDHIKKVR